MTDVRTRTPYAVVSAAERVEEATKAELIAVSRRIEIAALASPPPAVGATLQDERFLTALTRERYRRLAAEGTSVRLYARGLQSWLGPGMAGVQLDDDDPLVDEWCIVVTGPAPVAFAATDLGVPDCADQDRCFAYAVSRVPQVVADAAAALGL